MAQQRFNSGDLKALGLNLQPDGTYSKQVVKEQPKYKKPTHKELIKEVYENKTEGLVFEWADKHISLNEWYSSKHWSHRNKVAKEWHNFFKGFLIKPYPKFETYTITLKFNSRLDPSNTITMLKLVEDMMQEEGIIKNDNKDNCNGLHIIPDMTMRKFSYKIIVKH